MTIKQIKQQLFNYERRVSCTVRVGGVSIGGTHGIRVQSMTNTSTTDTNASVEQIMHIAKAGGSIVRLTTQGSCEATNLSHIKEELLKRGCNVPLVADVHFNPSVADVAVYHAEKVIINPGNYVDSARTFKEIEYSDLEYAAELERLKKRFVTFLNLCKEQGKAIRIGVNHGSLSDRIMNRYGDSPGGVVESCMEFLRICVEEHFFNVVVSIKTSNTTLMVRTVRLLDSVMRGEGMNFPLHLGVTEAGDAEDGRIKSAVGIGALLADGIGDTIRVSLAEAPEFEIPVANELVDYISLRQGHEWVEAVEYEGFDYISPEKRPTTQILNIGGGNFPVIIGSSFETPIEDTFIDFVIGEKEIADKQESWPLCTIEDLSCEENDKIVFLYLNYKELTKTNVEKLRKNRGAVILAQSNHLNYVGEIRALVHFLCNEGVNNPVIAHSKYIEKGIESLRIKAAADLGLLLIDGLIDGIWIENSIHIDSSKINELSFGILQATGSRISKTEYIACPGCGRTLYNLEKTLAKIKSATSHLKGFKIAVMGCIVNGPGEMADADYGYVGAARGKVSLYRKKECVEKNIPEGEAIEKLLKLIDDDSTKI